MSHYALVLKPPPEISSFIKAQKLRLRAAIGPFLSDNSQPHITYLLFKGGAQTLSKWENVLQAFNAGSALKDFHFNGLGTFSNGTLFYKPSEETSNFLKSEVRRLSALAPGSYYGRSLVPHLTIARKLNKADLHKALDVVEQAVFSFAYSALNIWKFNGYSWEENKMNAHEGTYAAFDS